MPNELLQSVSIVRRRLDVVAFDQSGLPTGGVSCRRGTADLHQIVLDTPPLMTHTFWNGMPGDRLLVDVSLWPAGLTALGDEVRRLEPFADLLHVDVSDAYFVPGSLIFGNPNLDEVFGWLWSLPEPAA